MAAPFHVLLLLPQDALVLWMNALARLGHAGTGPDVRRLLASAPGESDPCSFVALPVNDMGSSRSARGAIAAPLSSFISIRALR
jgi:hypothetical protein